MKRIILEKYLSIWKEYKDSSLKEVLNRGLTFQYDEDEINSDILFIGINPSYNGIPEDPKSYTKDEAINYPYFKPFQLITEQVCSYSEQYKWTHIDLLVFRETRQKRIEAEFFQIKEGIDFILDQLDVAKSRILTIKPKVIVVSNSLARTLLGKDRGINSKGDFNVWMGFKFEFDDKLGTDRIVEPETLRGTPVFFSSMLSGQRALDNGSKERLTWHIKQVLNSVDQKTES